MNAPSHQDIDTPSDPTLEDSCTSTTLALTLLLASEVNQQRTRAFTCGYCGQRHVLEQRRRGQYRVFVVTEGAEPGVCCLVAEYATPWEAAVHVTVAMTLGGYLHEEPRDGALF